MADKETLNIVLAAVKDAAQSCFDDADSPKHRYDTSHMVLHNMGVTLSRLSDKLAEAIGSLKAQPDKDSGQ